MSRNLFKVFKQAIYNIEKLKPGYPKELLLLIAERYK